MRTNHVAGTEHFGYLELDTFQEPGVACAQITSDGCCIFKRWPDDTDVDSFYQEGWQAAAQAAQHTYIPRHLAQNVV